MFTFEETFFSVLSFVPLVSLIDDGVRWVPFGEINMGNRW